VIFAKYRAADLYSPESPLPGQPMGAAPWVPGMPIPQASGSSSVRRSFDVGDVTGAVFRLFFSNIGSFLLITAIILLPILALQLVIAADQAQSIGRVVVAALIKMVGYQLATATLTYAVLHALRRRTISLGACLTVGVRSLITVVLIAILQSIAIAFGMILLIFPGIMIAMAYAVTIPAAIEESTGVTGAFSRSSDLTRGYRWQVFGVLFLVGLFNFAIAFIPAFAIGFQAAMSSASQPSSLVNLISELLSIVTTSLGATATAIIYYRLRSVKESIDIEELASTFD
jgi:hypothetical protein